MTKNYNDIDRKLAVMQLNELSMKDDDCLKVLDEAARKVRLIAAKKQIYYGKAWFEKEYQKKEPVTA